jgi:phage major head subunit gpT-like protein
MDEVIEPGLKKVFTGALNEDAEQSLIGPLYTMVNSERNNEDYLEMEDIGNMPTFNGDLTYTEFKQGNKKTVTPVEYALGLKVQRKFFDDDLYNVVEDTVKQMGEVGRYLMEQQAASPFVNAFTTGSFTTFDSLALCSGSHTFVTTSTTQSNSGTTAFSYAALDATISLMRRFTNSQDRLILRTKPTLLFGPVELGTQFAEVIQSELKAGSANNDKNVFNNKFKILTTPFLSDSNNWFLIDERRMKQFLIWQQRIPMEFKSTGDFDTFTRKWASYIRFAVQPLHWPWIYGQNVS